MTAAELYKAGKLAEAIDAQIQEVKSNPGDHSRRLFLFELLAFAGELDRARKQIDAIQYGDLALDAAVLSYAQLLDCESKRRKLFTDGLKPEFFAEPPEHIGWRLEAVNRLREKNQAEAHALLEKANAAIHARKGTLNTRPFTAFRDCDDLFAGVLEVMAHGNYYWVAIEQVRSVASVGPKFPRDLLWLPAKLEMADALGDVFLPAVYPFSHESSDNQIKLGRSTDWKAPEGGPVLGVGLRTYLVDDDALPILEWKQLEFEDAA
jgi:type VI secretion system protein ImpE